MKGTRQKKKERKEAYDDKKNEKELEDKAKKKSQTEG